jgi:DNA-binding SARP family transcriptional activator
VRLLQDDPLRESVHREVMSLLYRAGDRPAALRQFAVCTEVLQRELEVEPMGETSRLYRRILAEEPLDAAADGPATSAPLRRTPVPAGELEGAAVELRRAQSHLAAALRRIEPSRRQPQP